MDTQTHPTVKAKNIDHEVAHTKQGYDLGIGYIPAHMASMVMGVIMGMSLDGAHSHGALEKDWIDEPY